MMFHQKINNENFQGPDKDDDVIQALILNSLNYIYETQKHI